MIMWLTILVSESVCVMIERIGNENVTEFQHVAVWYYLARLYWFEWVDFRPFGNLVHAMIMLFFDSWYVYFLVLMICC